MNTKILITIIFQLGIFNYSFCQYTKKNEKDIRFKIGIETGFGFNEIDDDVSLTEIPNNNLGIYSGLVFKFIPKKMNNIALNSGVRYQKKGDWSSNNSSDVNSHILLLPFELEIYLFKAKKINPFLKLGTALEIKLNQVHSRDFYERNQISNNFRIGIGGIYSINPKHELGFQVQRTISRSTYIQNRYSPGGAPYSIKYQNSGFEFGLFLIKRIQSKSK